MKSSEGTSDFVWSRPWPWLEFCWWWCWCCCWWLPGHRLCPCKELRGCDGWEWRWFGGKWQVREVCWGILMFLWGRNNLGWSFDFFFSPFSWGWEGVWDCVGVSCVCPLICFFSPSPATESPLSLRLFKLIEQSMASFSFSACFSLLFFFVDDDDDGDLADDDDDDLAVAVVVVVAIVSMFAVEVFVGFVMVDSLVGVFFFFPPLTTWVQTSSLSGLSPVLVLGVSFLFTSVAAVAAAAAIVVVVFVVVSVVVVVVAGVVLVVFWGQDFEKCPSCLQFQHWGFLS